jgi:threonine/homoserine/homoserine lactone efflux protein
VTDPAPKDDKIGWADRPAFRRALFVALIAAAIGVAALGFVPQFHPHAVHFNVERFPVFFALFGFVAFSFIVLAGQHLRKLVTKSEDYYDGRE